MHIRFIVLLVLVLAGCVPLRAGPASEPVGVTPVAADTPEVLVASPQPTAIPTVAADGIPASGTPTWLPEVAGALPFDQEQELIGLGEALQRQPRDEVMLAQALGGVVDAQAVARMLPLDVQVGDVQEFWVTSTASDEIYAVAAALQYAGPVVLMYVEEGLALEQTALEQAALAFEQQIYPRTRALFGSEWQPGVDGDARITILNGRSPGGGVAGYFSSRDAVPRSVNRFSNEREMFFLNGDFLQPGEPAYLDVLAHEFQHMIHWNEQRSSALWFNEGCSTLSEDLNGFVNQGFVSAYLANPDVQLTAWSEEPGQAMAHYGAANLFMRYVYDQYAGDEGLAGLVRADAGNDFGVFVDLAAARRPDIDGFGDMFGDWAVANLVNDIQLADGRYGYGDARWLAQTARPQPLSDAGFSDSVQQFGVDYLELPAGPMTVAFAGSTEVALVGAQPHDQWAWWSGRGDNSVSSLTHALDLRGLKQAVLQFDAWFELEQSYDYAFVSVSTDEGITWATLPGVHTTTDDPQGANYGYGFNGVSGSPGITTGSGIRGTWVQEEIDLTPYVGQAVLVRFWQVSDDGFHAPGLLLDNISVCDGDAAGQCVLVDDVEAGAGAWQAQGFARIDGMVRQGWEVRLVRTDANGQVGVESVPVDAAGQAVIRTEANERAVLVVAAITPYTTERATYRVSVER